jgi:hypothetical protein
MIAIPAVATQARSAKLLVWLFNVVGSLDLISAITLATVYNAAPFMGPAYWILKRTSRCHWPMSGNDP